ncbi:hypothetical protein JCM21142_134828 [Saccharicrinis fermentans DSM 9555 = JCM 21142]|uniref:Uncharacterized protein n=1 Tax=Saccharicrinis fermentans DSM 9555 = JCM 21142 TaxID=869213 RepID=W7YC53_9BACT|nr:hypothetical protein JCM21142_134828 [Saccharicrinis fermentans DSM 9555 = JCM 21142]
MWYTYALVSKSQKQISSFARYSLVLDANHKNIATLNKERGRLLKISSYIGI